MTPEAELLLCCAKNNINSENAEKIQKLLSKDLDWSQILHLAFGHGVAPLLYKSLKLTQTDLVPKNIFIQLKDNYLITLQNNMYLANELGTISTFFAEKDIQSIAYKGPVLAEYIYGNLGLRQFIDLDIIIHIQDVESAKEVLLTRGYKINWPKIRLTKKQERSHIRTKYNYQFIREEDGVTVELHWNITPNYFLFPRNNDWLWENLIPVTLSGKTFYTFSPEDYLIILCVHGSNHCWIRLNWICDISELIKKNPLLKWENLINEAATQGSERMVLLGVLLAHELLGTELPSQIWERVENHLEVKSLARQVISKYSRGSWVGSGVLEIPRFHLKARDNLIDRWRYLLHLQEPSNKDWAFFNLPESLDFLYYLIRPIRLGIEYGIVPIQSKIKQIRF